MFYAEMKHNFDVFPKGPNTKFPGKTGLNILFKIFAFFYLFFFACNSSIIFAKRFLVIKQNMGE